MRITKRKGKFSVSVDFEELKTLAEGLGWTLSEWYGDDEKAELFVRTLYDNFQQVIEAQDHDEFENY